jgi:hypothetical protein
MTEVANEGDYARVLRLGRIRQKHWYERNVKKVADNRRKDRELFKELKANAGIITTRQPIYNEPEQEQNIQEEYYEPEKENIPVEPEPVEKVRFTNLTDKQIKKLKKRQTNSKQTYAGIIEILKKHTTSKKSVESYTTAIKQLYEMTDTNINQPLNLNNPQLIFQKLDTLKYKGKDYGIDKLASFAQTLVLLSDIQKGFNLDVNTESYNIYNNKFKELKIMKRDNQTNNQTKKSKEIILFSNILRKALEVYGIQSKEFLYLRLYQLASLRDNFQLLIITDPKDAVSKTNNYIIIPPIIKKKIRNKMIVFKPEGSLIIQNYKTEKKGYLKLPFLLTEETTNLVRAYMERKNLKVGDYLFGKSAMSAFVSQLLRGLGIEQIGSNINYLRKAVSTEWHLHNPNAPAKDRLLFAERMAHSVDMNKGYVRLISEQKL